MTATPIQTQDEFEAAVARLREISDAPPGAVDTDEMQSLLLVIDAWQAAHPEAVAEPTEEPV